MSIPTDLPTPPEWMSRARCKGTDPEIFFSEHGNIALAKSICERCPVKQLCLQWALDFETGVRGPGEHAAGVYGGLSANERNKISGRRAS